MIHKVRHAESIEEQVRDIARPMRGLTSSGQVKLEKLAKKVFKETGRLYLQHIERVFEILGLPKNPTEEKYFVSPVWLKSFDERMNAHAPACKCVSCDVQTKAYYYDESDIERIEREFKEKFGLNVNRALDKSGKELIESLMSSSKPTPGKSKAPWQDMYYNGTIFAGDDAYLKALEEWRKQPESWREENPFPKDLENTFFDKNASWIKQMYQNGYGLVTAQLTEKNLPAIKEIMNNASSKFPPLTANQQSYLLKERFGEGSLGHWQRLVRTELAGAIDKEHYHRMVDLEVGYIQFSAAPDACIICTTYAKVNDGYYTIESSPDIPEDTHPNCRCLALPVWNLPKYARANTSLPAIGLPKKS